MNNPCDSIPFLPAVVAEFESASRKFKPFNSAHEGFAVLKEEVDELWDEVKFNPKNDPAATGPEDAHNRHVGRMRAEAIQVAAMALRFLKDVK